MYNYAISFKTEAGQVTGFCKALPEFKVTAQSEDEVMSAAIAEIDACLGKRVGKRMPIPEAIEPQDGERIVRLSAVSVAKAALWTQMLKLDVRKADLWKKLEVKPVQVDRLLDFSHPSKMQSLEEALASISTGIRVSPVDLQWIELAQGGFFAERLVDAFVAAGVDRMPIGKNRGGLEAVKTYSLDYILRTRYARQPDTMQATDMVLDSLQASGHFVRTMMIDPVTNQDVECMAIAPGH